MMDRTPKQRRGPMLQLEHSGRVDSRGLPANIPLWIDHEWVYGCGLTSELLIARFPQNLMAVGCGPPYEQADWMSGLGSLS